MMGLLAGEVDFLIDTPSAALPQINAGTVRPLAVTSLNRIPELEQVPTLQEEGLDGFESLSWFAMLAPAGVSEDVLAKLNSMLSNTLKDSEFVASLSDVGFTPEASEGKSLVDHMTKEYEMWGTLITEAGIVLH